MLHYNPQLKFLARELRKNSTLAEVLLWRHLKGKALKGCDFHRQKPLDCYIVDFFCPELRLAIEIDGCSHDAKYEADEKRQERLEELGIRFLRFRDKDVKQNLCGVVQMIEQWIDENRPEKEDGHTPPLRATPLKRGF